MAAEPARSAAYPPIADYALISDCHCCALVSNAGAIDWCCMPRMDSDSCFGRLLDWQRGGYCQLAPSATYSASRRYEPRTMVLNTRFDTAVGSVQVWDFFCVAAAIGERAHHQLVRIVEGIEGEVELGIVISPRFDYGETIPYTHGRSPTLYTAWGGNKGLIIHCSQPLQLAPHGDMQAAVTLAPGQRCYLSMSFEFPEYLDRDIPTDGDFTAALERSLEQCLQGWRSWASQLRQPYADDPQTARSALVLKALTFERTGAIAAAPTTSLPERIGGDRNWDYRFSWVRDSIFAVSALEELGFSREAGRFSSFLLRSCAGSAEELQVLYGIDGGRRQTELELHGLDGYRDSRPVRIGNLASRQCQLDIYAELVELACIQEARGTPVDAHYWRFLAEVVEAAARAWVDPDHSIWEMRCEPRHFVFSKAMCWAALDRGIGLAERHGFDAPLARWMDVRDEIRATIEERGYDHRRGAYLQAFDHPWLDASLLLLPRFGYLAYDDPRMVATTAAIRAELTRDELLMRYNSPDGLPGKEGMFLPCTFWLVSCLARQGQRDIAEAHYRRALACANDLGLFAEEYAVAGDVMLGNFPLVLTHVSQITAYLALAGCARV